MQEFVYNGQPSRVVFGAGALKHLEREIDALGAKRALVLSTPEQAAQAQHIADLLGARAAGIFPGAVMHVPIETAREARAEAARLGADCAVAVGGGSTTGLGKAIALDSGLPILAIPTTYAGSEMTPIYGITEAGLKKTGRDPRVLPRTVIYDPLLSLTLPVGLSVNLPHAEVHTVVLPHAIAFNAEHAPLAMQRIARALKASSAAVGLFDLASTNGAPVALRDIGMREEDLDRAADIAVSNPYWNPRPFGKEQRAEIRNLLQRAFEGTRPN